MEGFSISNLEKLVKDFKGIEELNQILVPQLEEANAKITELSSKLEILQHNNNRVTRSYEKEREKNKNMKVISRI